MPKVEIKGIVFDLGNVLVSFDHSLAVQKVAALASLAPQGIYDLFFNSHNATEFEKGKISPGKFFSEVKNTLKLKITYQDFLLIWNDIFFLTKDNQKVLRLVQILNKQYCLAMLSNINILHYDYLKKEFPVFGAFDYIFASFKIGFIKPDPKIYLTALNNMGVLPEEAFYTDDRCDFIKEARKLGIKAYVYKGDTQLRQDLFKEGISINEPSTFYKIQCFKRKGLKVYEY